MNRKRGLLRRYRGIFRPADRAWHRWLRAGKPKRWGRERVLRAWRRGDLIAICVALLLLATAVSPLLLIVGAAQRPLSFRGFVLTAVVRVALAAAVTAPLWLGSVADQAREVARDRAMLLYLILGAWIALAYQKRSSDLSAVRDLYHQWLDVKSHSMQAAVLLGRPALRLQHIRELGQAHPELQEALRQRMLVEARDAQTAIQEAAYRAMDVARRATTLRMFTLNESAMRASELLNAQLGLLVQWQQEILGHPSETPDPPSAVTQAMRDVQRACEVVTGDLERWLRT